MSISVIISAIVVGFALGLVLVGIAYVLAHGFTYLAMRAHARFTRRRHIARMTRMPERIRRINTVC